MKKHVLILFLFSAFLTNRGIAQSTNDTRDVLNVLFDTLSALNVRERVTTFGTPRKPYLVTPISFSPHPKSYYFGYLNMTLLKYGYVQDTALATQTTLLAPIDISTLVTNKKHVILSNYLPEGKDFERQIDQLFYKLSIATPFFFGKNKYCVIEIISDDGAEVFLFTKERSAWSFTEKIGSWVN